VEGLPFAACSRSASSKTRKGQSPPSSSVNFFSPSEQILATSLPIRVLPVKVTFLTSSCRHKASDNEGVFSRLVVKTLKTPGGKPACRAKYPSVKTERGVSGDGLTIMVQPAASAAPALRRIIALKIQLAELCRRTGGVKNNWKIPGTKCYGDTNGLFDGKDTASRCCGCRDSALDSLGFSCEPPG
jgi:hypothetical protein